MNRSAPGSLHTLLSSAAGALGVAGFVDELGLCTSAGRRPSAVCVLLVDGFGLDLATRHADRHPALAAALSGGTVLTAGLPSSTSTSRSPRRPSPGNP